MPSSSFWSTPSFYSYKTFLRTSSISFVLICLVHKILLNLVIWRGVKIIDFEIMNFCSVLSNFMPLKFNYIRYMALKQLRYCNNYSI